MPKNFFLLVLSSFFLMAPSAKAQFSFVYDGSLAVVADGQALRNPWAGGLNGVQFQKMDLNNNGTEDLVVFDRTAAKVFTFLWEAGQWQYRPAYEAAFPPIRNWLVLYDYNCDGRKDLFYSIPQGMSVYAHKGFSQGMPLFELEVSPLRYRASNGNLINLNANVTDIPALVDADGDGDMDILIFAPIIGGTVEYYRNLSSEQGDGCGLELIRETDRWGRFEETGDCETYLFDQPASGRLTHNGASVLLLDLDGDERLDLLIGEMDCANLVAMINEGTTDEAVFRSSILRFPTDDPVHMPFFPAPFYEDMDNDGRRDLIVSPNVYDNFARLSDFRESVTLFRNVGSDHFPAFERVSDRFLQEDMIDLGERAMPTVADIDGDGARDLVVGHFGNLAAEGFYATLVLFRNTGSDQEPSFELVDKDFLGLSALNATFLNPQFADLDGNGRQDLVLAYAPDGQSRLTLAVYPDQSTGNQPPLYDAANRYLVADAINIRPTEKPYFYDIDQDGEIDLLVGRQFTGELNYYRNEGDFRFVLEAAAFGGIEGVFDKSPAAFVADLLSDGEPDLIIGDESGQLTIYPDFRQQSGAFNAADAVFYNAQRQALGSYNFGRWAVPTMLGKQLFVGTMGGGLMSFRLDNTLASLPQQPSPDIPKIEIFPNPAKDRIFLTTDTPGSFALTDLAGREVANTQLEAGRSHSLSLPSLPAGVYIYRFVATGRADASGKLILIP